MSSLESQPRRSLAVRVATTLVVSFVSVLVILSAVIFLSRVTTRLLELEDEVSWLARPISQDLELSVHARYRVVGAATERIQWLQALGDELVHAIVFAPDGTAVTGVDAQGPIDERLLLGRQKDDVTDIAWYERTTLVEVRPTAVDDDDAAAADDGPGEDAGPVPVPDEDDIFGALELEEAALTDDADDAEDAPDDAGQDRRSYVRVTLSALPAARSELMYVLIAGLFLGVAALLVVRRTVQQGMDLLEPAFSQAQIMRDGDFTQRSEAEYTELAALLEAFNDIGDSLSGMILDVRRLAGEVSATVERVQAESSAIQLGVTRELGAVDDTEGAVRAMRDSVESGAATMRDLVARAETSSSDTARIADTNQETGESLGMLTEQVSRQRRSIDVLGQRSRALTRSAELLSSSTTSARDVAEDVLSRLAAAQDEATEAVRVASAAQTEAEQGGAAIENAVDRISEIAARTTDMEGSLGALVTRVEQMQPLLVAIDDVTASTQLLALNASILAAQAGEHGRPFQVVVEQLKQLARRTQALTGEANAAVDHVLEQRGRTARAGEHLTEVVGESLEDARRAGSALSRIRDGIETSHSVSQRIAGSVRQQQENLREAVAGIEKAAGAGPEVEAAARSVVEECVVLEEVGTRVDQVAVDVVRATEAQSALTERVGGALREVTDQVKTLAGSQQRQDADMQRVLRTMGQIRSVAEDARARAGALEDVVEGLRHSADRLMDGLARFRTFEGRDR